jgi:hypothetical protein
MWCETELCWTMVSAIGQVAGAFATFFAVVVSLFIAFRAPRPRVRLVVGERIIFPSEMEVLVFEVANAGDRPFHVRGIGWQTGWLKRGPAFLKSQPAIQITEPIGYVASADPPYELQPGAVQYSYRLMGDMLGAARARAEPFFTRDWPLIGRRETRVRAYAYTADGHEFRVKPERSLMLALVKAEKRALIAAE